MNVKISLCKRCEMPIETEELMGTNKNGSLNEEYCIYCFKDGKFVEFCQSCGMPLESEEILGTNKNGSLNNEYCTHCFQNGEYTSDVTMEEMIEISLKHLKELLKDDPSFDEKNALEYMKAFFPQLKRWSGTV
ncbi:zinc ribbon domain-containing protein [Fusobacterium sp. PH5-44]|uniref:zinc ribbon domain-containing protein n=1 Tax=unclassified Fusobacterium TaxID=2648384 RepID=UPI003D22F304